MMTRESDYQECIDDFSVDESYEYKIQKLVTGDSIELDYNFYPCSQFEEDKLQTGVTCE